MVSTTVVLPLLSKEIGLAVVHASKASLVTSRTLWYVLYLILEGCNATRTHGVLHVRKKEHDNKFKENDRAMLPCYIVLTQGVSWGERLGFSPGLVVGPPVPPAAWVADDVIGGRRGVDQRQRHRDACECPADLRHVQRRKGHDLVGVAEVGVTSNNGAASGPPIYTQTDRWQGSLLL